MESVLDQLATDLEGKAIIGIVPQAERKLFTTYGVKGIPATFIWYGSEVKQSYVGFRDKAFLAKALKEYVD